MKKKNNIIKRIFFIVLFIIFLPLILIYFCVKSISRRIRMSVYKKNKVSGRKLLLTASVESIEEMYDFELYDLFKYLFFYQGFNVKLLNYSLNKTNLLISKDNQNIFVKYDIVKKNSTKKHINCLIKNVKKTKNVSGLYITNVELNKAFVDGLKTYNIECVDKTGLNLLIHSVADSIQKNNIIDNRDIDKSIDQMIDDMYPNRI